MSVEVIFGKSFCETEQEIVDRFIGFHNALIESDIDMLNEILSDGFEGLQIPSRSQSKAEFVSAVDDGSLNFSKIEIFEPKISLEGDGASWRGKIRLTAEVNGRELRWVPNTVAEFEMTGGKWQLVKWEY